MDAYKEVELLIVDDFMTTPIATQNAVDLFEVVEAREGRRGTIIVSSFTGHLRGKSALMMFGKHANLKHRLGSRCLWPEGYCVSTVGLDVAAIAKCIREQGAYGIALDKLSVKECEDTFGK